MEPQKLCPHCKTPVTATDFYCPSCGKKLVEKVPSTSVLTQLIIYLLSFFLPPLGAWPAVKYLRRPDQKSKNIGIVALVLTVLSTVLTIYLSVGLVDQFTKEYTYQLGQYENMGL